MSVELCGLHLDHPIVNGSGTFDAIAARRVFGEALDREFPFAAFVSKTITLTSRAGNPPPRLWEAQAGLVNSIGLPNRGLRGYIERDLPELASLPVPLITNVMGSTAEEIAELLGVCDEHEEIAALELNVSCPNVHTGLDIGTDPVQLERVVAAVRPATTKPLIVKLTPNCADVGECARAAEAGGADAVSLINTLRALALDPSARSCAVAAPGASAARAALPRRWLGGGGGGLSGAAVRAIALAQVAAVASSVSIPVVGMGGVQTATHARRLLDVGARLVAVGTESFRDPTVGSQIARGLAAASAP
ncbi:MAG TPA: HisA/HisF-related TIM barrel protein [Solirubrobacteraceae bacterium]|jgi:dihydroorotate dehydrogenase (NAD+) catalytic subunit|nr:HisA/HisF-related TIM barrel protein [Solirubrobacteraceae bacterium]